MLDGDTVQVTAAGIARSLGGGWRYAAGDAADEAELHGPDGMVLAVDGYRMRSADPLRLEIRGRFPAGSRNAPAAPTVTCAAGRGGEQIARDIERRLLPVYAGQLADTAVKDRAALAADDSRAQVMAEAAGILGLPPTAVRSDLSSSQLSLYDDGCAHGTIRASFAASVLHLDLHGVPAPVALAMLRVMARKDLTGGS